jgi:hypothetical protein
LPDEAAGCSLVVFGALALAPGVPALSASLTVTPTSVAVGTTLSVKGLRRHVRRRRLLDREGPEHLRRGRHLRPRDACSSFQVGTTGWAAGKYRIDGFEFTAKGAKRIDSVTLTVTYVTVTGARRNEPPLSSSADQVIPGAEPDRLISHDDACNRAGRRSGRDSTRAVGSPRNQRPGPEGPAPA